MFPESVFLIEDSIATADPVSFAELPMPKFLISERSLDTCLEIADKIGAQGIFAQRGAVYRLEVGGHTLEGGCGEVIQHHVLMSVIPHILSQYFPMAKNLYAFVHSENSKILGFDQHHNVYMVTFAGGAPGLREVAERMVGLYMPDPPEDGVLPALKILAKPYTWNPWAKANGYVETRVAR